MHNPSFIKAIISGDRKPDSPASWLISKATTASRNSTRYSLGCLQRGLKLANKMTITASFSLIATLLVATYFVLAIAELMVILFISPMKLMPISSITMYISLACNEIMLAQSVGLLAATPQKGLSLYFIPIILDLLVSSLSTGLEITGTFTESYCGALSLGILVVRLYIGFRILARIHQRRIRRAARLLRAQQIQLGDLLLASHETNPTRKALLERIAYKRAQVERNQLVHGQD